MHPPDVQRLSEIADLALQAMSAGKVHDAADADGAVKDESTRGRAGTFELSLQQSVSQHRRFAQVLDEVANTVAAARRDHVNVGLGDRFQDGPVHALVEGEGLAVEGV